MMQRVIQGVESVMYGAVLLCSAAIPLIIGKGFSGPFLLVKQLVLTSVVLLLLLSFAVKAVFEKEVVLHRTALDRSAFVLLVSLLISVLFGEKANGFFGRNDYFVLSFVNFMAFAFYAWNIVQNITTIRRWQNLINLIMVVGGVASAVFVLRAAFGLNLLNYFGAGLWSSVDLANTNFGLFALSTFFIGYGTLVKKDVEKTALIASSVVSIISLIAIIILGFKLIWGLLAFGLLLLVAVVRQFKNEARKNFQVITISLAALFIIFSTVGLPRLTNAEVPSEAALGARPSWNITSSALFSGAKTFLVGTGPGTFKYNFSAFRDSSFNSDDLISTIRFSYPSNSFFAMLGENGTIFTLAFLVLVLSVFLHLFHALKEVKNGPAELEKIESGFLELESVANHSQAFSTFVVAVPFVVLTFGMAFLFYGFVVWFLWWTLLGTLIVGLALFKPGIIRLQNFNYRNLLGKPYAGYVALSIPVLIVVSLSVYNLRFHLADRFFAAALAAQDFEEAENNLEKAIRFRPGYDTYHAALGRALFNDAAAESRKTNPDIVRISELLAGATKESKRATELSPKSVVLWENMADLLEASSVLAPEAGDSAIRAMEVARKLEPSNPFLAERLGVAYEKAGKSALALQQLEDSLELKKDHLPAYALLSDIYERQKEPDKAILVFETALQVAPDNTDVKYNYGRLIYNRNRKGDRELAEKIWLSIVDDNPSYSNALFSLGLLNELKGKRQTALDYYYKVRDLNPENEDVAAKIKKLER